VRPAIVVVLLAVAAGCEASPPPPGPRILIDVDPSHLRRFDLSMDAIASRLRQKDVSILSRRETQFEVRSALPPEALLRLEIGQKQGVPIRLQDVARIETRP
jgi:multidrug efflux pump subunit AcrB